MVANQSQAQFDAVSLTVIMADATGGTSVNYSNGGCPGGSSAADCGAGEGALAIFTGTAAQRHLDGQNFAYADGHVKWHKGQNATTSAAVYNGAYGTGNGRPTFRAVNNDA
jgi:prepilin-type processing-associated H-X9-DG protein